MSLHEPGAVLAGRYRVVRKLGAGGMGEVFYAERVSDGAPVVIKTLLASWAKNPVSKKRFAVEARAARRLDHPCIVRVLDYDAEGDTPFLVMEHLGGRTLSSVIREPPMMAVPRALGLARQMLEALSVAHAHGVVHRDLKPANVMVLGTPESGEQVKLLDFGLARILDEERRTRLTRTGQILGTPGYLAPEQAKGDPIDARTDIWALGVMVYVMLCERLPFPGKDTSERIIAMLTEAPLPMRAQRPDVPEAVVAAIMRCLEKDPADRPPNAESLARSLADAVEDRAPRPEATRRNGAVSATPKTREEPPAPAIASTIAAVAPPSAVPPSEMPPPEIPRRKRRFALLLAALFVVGVAGVLATLAYGIGGASLASSEQPALAASNEAQRAVVPVVVGDTPTVASSGDEGSALEDEPDGTVHSEPNAAESGVEAARDSPVGEAADAPLRPEHQPEPAARPEGSPTPQPESRSHDDATPTDVEILARFQNGPPELRRRGSPSFVYGVETREARDWVDDRLGLLRPCFADSEPSQLGYIFHVEFEDDHDRVRRIRFNNERARSVSECVGDALHRAEGPRGARFDFRLKWN